MDTTFSPETLDALRARVSCEVLDPDSPGYDVARRCVMSRFDDVLPAVVVKCLTVEDVRQAVLFARANDLTPTVRSGGHSFAGFSSGAGVLIDVTGLSAIRMEGSRAHVGSGARVGEVSEHLFRHGRVLPGGSCPTVGIAGTALGGGFGILGRLFGFTSDHVVGAEVVLADGQIVTCDEDRHPDLLWALRGAGGGNFGVVTALVFETHPAADMTSFYYVWDFEHAEAAFLAWQDWVSTTPDAMAAGLAYTSTDRLEDPPIVELWGAMRDAAGATTPILDRLVAAIGAPPRRQTLKTLPYDETAFFQADILDLTQSGVAVADDDGMLDRQGYRASKSELFNQPIPAETAAALARAFVAEREPGQYRGLEFAPFGGAYNRVAPTATAFFHRDIRFSIKHTMLLRIGPDAEEKAAAHAWVTRMWELVHPHGTGRVYPNFPDVTLAAPHQAYFGDNYPRLRAVKRRYDPDNLFRFAQSIEP